MKSLADALVLISAIALAFPAWYFNRYAHLAAKSNLKNIELGEPEFQEEHKRILEELQTLRDEWRPWKAWCLHIGTVAGLLAAALTLWNGLHEKVLPAAH